MEVTSPEVNIDWCVLTNLFHLLSAPHLFSALHSFNLLSFAEGLQPWQDTLVGTTDAACHEAMQWVTNLHAQGSTSVLQALLASSTTKPDPVAKQKYHHPYPDIAPCFAVYKEHFRIYC